MTWFENGALARCEFCYGMVMFCLWVLSEWEEVIFLDNKCVALVESAA